MNDSSLYASLKKLASQVPSMSPHIQPLLKKYADAIRTPSGGWSQIITGDKVRIRYKGHPENYAVIEELPRKGAVRLKRYVFNIGNLYRPIMQHPQSYLFRIEHLKKDWNPNANMTAEQAANALTSVIEKAAVEIKKSGPVPSWFDATVAGLGDVEEVHYLQVEPMDYAPIEIQEKNFHLNSSWTEFVFTEKSSDFRGQDVHYTRYVSSSPTGARKLFQALKANPDLFKGKTWREMQDILTKARIPAKLQFSVWR